MVCGLMELVKDCQIWYVECCCECNERKSLFCKTEKITQLQRNKYESEKINVAFTKALKRLTN